MSNFVNASKTRTAERLGHYSSQLLIGSILAAILLGVYPAPGALAFTAPIVVFVFVIFSWLLMREHDRKLCEACMTSMPLNPAQQAERFRMRFLVAHAGTEPRFFIPYLIVLIGSSFEMQTLGRLPWAAIQLSMVYLILAQGSHRRLQPWCPQCQGGGGEDVKDTPPVIPHDDRQLV